MTGEQVGPKTALREQMRVIRGAIPPNERARRASLVEERLLGLEEFRVAHMVLLFYSFGSEVATRGIARHILAKGKRLLFPYLTPRGMEAAEVRPGDPLVQSGYGPREPSRRHPLDPDEVDLVVTPGLAFDRRGFRLGYGGGHYDRYLSRLRPETIRIGLAYGDQLIDHVPDEPSDQKVHLVVTESEVVDCRGPG
jgi:5-formyltetrahydrofolate cyclo-ligase